MEGVPISLGVRDLISDSKIRTIVKQAFQDLYQIPLGKELLRSLKRISFPVLLQDSLLILKK